MYAKISKTMLGLIILTALLLTGCGTEAPPPQAAPPPPVVTVDHPKQQTVTEYLDFTGKTQAVETVEVRARVEGYLKEIQFTDGARVTKGDALFVIDPAPYQAVLTEAEAALASRKAELNLAETVYRRRNNALADNAVSELAVEEAKAQLDLAAASVNAAQAMVDRARLDVSYTQITAPISGRISRRLVDRGNLLRNMEDTVLATIIADDPIYVYFSISEGDLLRFKQLMGNDHSSQGHRIMLGLSNGDDFPYEGVVDYVDNRVDADSGTLQVRARIDNGNRELLPGLFARIRLPVQEIDGALLVPETAVGMSQAGRFLLVVDDEEKAAFRPVTVGHQVDELRVITAGVSVSDRVIVRGGQRVQPGMPVTAQMAGVQAEAAAALSGGSQ